MARNVVIGSAVSQVLLLIYLELIEWVDIFPWNDVRKGNGQEALDVVLGLLMAGVVLATVRRWRIGMALAVMLYTVWLALQITTFWTAYIGGASPRWQRIYAVHFAQTIQWLPRWDTHLPPDASHFVLQILLVAALITTATATLRVR
jgi:hypothetical protein